MLTTSRLTLYSPFMMQISHICITRGFRVPESRSQWTPSQTRKPSRVMILTRIQSRDELCPGPATLCALLDSLHYRRPFEENRRDVHFVPVYCGCLHFIGFLLRPKPAPGAHISRAARPLHSRHPSRGSNWGPTVPGPHPSAVVFYFLFVRTLPPHPYPAYLPPKPVKKARFIALYLFVPRKIQTHN